MLAHFLGEEPGQLAAIRGVGMQDAESAEALLLDGIGRDSFGLKLIGERRAEHIVAESSDVGEGRRRRDQGMWARSASSAMTGRFFERSGPITARGRSVFSSSEKSSKNEA